MKKFYNFIRAMAYLPTKLIYPTKVLHAERMPRSERLISVSNHYSWKDIPVLAVGVKGFRRFIAKKEIGKNKLVHALAESIGVIFIDRDKPDMTAIRESVRTLKEGNGIAIFPEGTRNKNGDGDLQAIKGGVTLLALKGNAPIVPLMLHHKSRAFRKNYLFVGEPFDLSEFTGKLLDADTIAAASEKVLLHMQNARDEMEVFIREKGWIAQKKERKAFLKRQRKQNTAAKKSYAEFLRNLRHKKGASHDSIAA